MTIPKRKANLLIIYLVVLFLSGANAALAQSDAQLIVNNLESGNREMAQFYMDRITGLEAGRLQCRLLTNFNYVFDYDSSLFNMDNMQWLLDGFKNKAYAWPSTCNFNRQEQDAQCLIFGDDLNTTQAGLLYQVFEQLSICPVNDLQCTNAHNMYENAEHMDVYLYVVERFFSEANQADISRSSCTNSQTWEEAVVRLHRGYFNLGWAVYSSFQLESGAVSLQKSLAGMQRLASIESDLLVLEYESLRKDLADSDSAGANGKYRMLMNTLLPYIE